MRWQYYQLHVGPTSVADGRLRPQLDDLGQQGWELAGTISITDRSGTVATTLLFKRPSN